MLNTIFLDAIRKFNTDNTNCARVFETMKMILEYSKLAKEEGLLALEEAVINLTGKNAEDVDYQEFGYCHDSIFGANQIFVVLILLVTSGTEPELIRQNGMERYWANNPLGAEALASYMAIVGALHIQSGMNEWVLEQTLMAALPENAEKEYILRKRRMDAESKDAVTQIPEDFFEENENDESCSAIVTRFEKYVERMSDISLQRVLREINCSGIVHVLKAVNGTVRRKIFNNVSKRLSGLLYMTAKHSGSVRLDDAEETIYRIFNICTKLENDGEIVLGEYGCSSMEIKEVLYEYEHKIVLMNREREWQIQKLRREISDLEQRMVKL